MYEAERLIERSAAHAVSQSGGVRSVLGAGSDGFCGGFSGCLTNARRNERSASSSSRIASSMCAAFSSGESAWGKGGSVAPSPVPVGGAVAVGIGGSSFSGGGGLVDCG